MRTLVVLLGMLVALPASAATFRAQIFRVTTNGPFAQVLQKDDVGQVCVNSLATFNAALNSVRDEVGSRLNGEVVFSVTISARYMVAVISRVETGGPYTVLVYKNDRATKVTSGLATITGAMNQARDDIAAGLGGDAATVQLIDVLVASGAP